MKILYLTTALLPEDYAWALAKGLPVGNPSNQNFHSRLISALGEKMDVLVLSLVPSALKKTTFLSSKNYFYFNCETPIFSLNEATKKVVKFVKEKIKNEEAIVIFDSLNIHLARIASVLAKETSSKSMAILTDNPKNLAKSTRIYQKLFAHYLRQANAYLSLSKGLLKALVFSAKPSLVFEGIVEEGKPGPSAYPERGYLYFGGTLQSRYGVLNLIKAYQAVPMDYDLYLAGHHAPEGFETLFKDNPRIHFLGQVSKEENCVLEAHAALVVNPRPFDPVLDQESVPSKLLEYLASGTPILSVSHTRLHELFPDDVNWLAKGEESEIESFFKAHLDGEGHFQNLHANNAKEKALALYGTKAVGQRLYDFLISLN
jgi:glycosyltransferase involved in cell wall biosynthesis